MSNGKIRIRITVRIRISIPKNFKSDYKLVWPLYPWSRSLTVLRAFAFSK